MVLETMDGSGGQPSAVLCQSATAAAASGATATLPAAGAGLFHYITMIQIVKFYSTVGTAAAAPVVVTTTNLPGSLAFSFDQSAATLGTSSVQIFTPDMPLKSSAANTATTFVAPAQAQTLWRINIFYFAAP